MTVQLSVDPALSRLAVGVVEFSDVVVSSSSDDQRRWCDSLVHDGLSMAQSKEYESLRQEVRSLLRFGKFKASGRSKPAQEYLMRCAQDDGKLPEINSPVDALNAVSLVVGLPISLLSLRKCSRELAVRRGTIGEVYEFNSAGQILDLTDMIVTCDASVQPSRPVGTPVKDSMAGKIENCDAELVAVIYAPDSPPGESAIRKTIELLSEGLQRFCAAQLRHTQIVRGPTP